MENTRKNSNNRIESTERRKRSFYHKALFISIAVIIIVLDAIFLILPDKEISETENRSLQLFPKLNFTTLTNGKFESRFDAYVADQFPGRDAWVSMKSAVDIMAGKTQSGNIFLGKDGYLIQDMKLPSDAFYEEKMEEIRSFVSAHGNLSVSALIAPTALSVLNDYLPANADAVAADEDAFFEQVKSDLSGFGIRFVDTRDVIKAASSEEKVYYRTDHHWTTQGAYAAYREYAKQMNLPGLNASYSEKLVTDSFSGTLTASSGFRTGETDRIYVFLPDSPVNYTVLNLSDGGTSSSFYKTENLKIRDKYTVFFGGNYPEIKIETEADSRKVLLVFKDSYANCFVPFLVSDYRCIIMVDPRYYNGDMNELIESEKVTDVLYLYNITAFAE